MPTHTPSPGGSSATLLPWGASLASIASATSSSSSASTTPGPGLRVHPSVVGRWRVMFGAALTVAALVSFILVTLIPTMLAPCTLPQAASPASADERSSSTHPPQQRQREIVSIQTLLPMVTTPGDSVGEMLTIRQRTPTDAAASGTGGSDDPSAAASVEEDPFHYELCSFTNVCADSDSLYLFVQDEGEYNRMQAIIDRCHTPDQYRAPEKFFHPCHCFLKPQFQMKLLPFFRRPTPKEEHHQTTPTTEQAKESDNANLPSHQRQTRVHPLTELNTGHYFRIHKYVGRDVHHIAHWAQKVLLFQSAMQHFAALPSTTRDNARDIVLSTYNPETLETSSGPYPRDHYSGGDVIDAAPAASPSASTSPSGAVAHGPPFSPLSGLVLHDMALPMSEHELGIFNTSLRAVLLAAATIDGPDHDHPGLTAYFQGRHLKERSRYHRESGNMIFADELDRAFAQARAFWDQEQKQMQQQQQQLATTAAAASSTGGDPSPSILLDPSSSAGALSSAFPRCYSRLTFTRAFGIFSTSSLDTSSFRRLAYAEHGLTARLAQRCPPRRVVFLYRENRGILNWEAIGRVVREVTGGSFGSGEKEMVRATIDGQSSTRTQVDLFASAGLLLSSHSSQLVNVMYTHPHASMVEVTSEYFNSDFSEYAHGMGVHFQYAIGGEVAMPPGEHPDPLVRECTQILSVCRGDSHCILRERYKCARRRSFVNKNRDFHADLDAVRLAVENAVKHLNWACGGKW